MASCGNISKVVFANSISVALVMFAWSPGTPTSRAAADGDMVGCCFAILSCWSLDRIAIEDIVMVKSRQQTSRKPATKYANLQKKMQKQKAASKKKTGKKKTDKKK